MILRLGALLFGAALLCLSTGCGGTRQTTTERTALEMTLLATAAERTVVMLTDDESLARFAGMSFHLDLSDVDATDRQWIDAQFRRMLLNAGMRTAEEREDADIVAHPSVAVAAIDDSDFILGIPSLGIPVPGSGVVETPELALLGRKKQIARNRMGMYLYDANDGALLLDLGTHANSTFMSRWRVLFAIAFSRTNLEEPYRKPKDKATKE